MVINWNIIMMKRNLLYKLEGRLLSLNKCFKTLFDNIHRLRDALKHGQKRIEKYIRWTEKILDKNHWLEKKKNTTGLENIFYLLFCKSNEYVYI